jgi:hypothetical protein
MRRDSENPSPARIPFKVSGALHGFILLKQNEEGFLLIRAITMVEGSMFAVYFIATFASCFIILAENLYLFLSSPLFSFIS